MLYPALAIFSMAASCRLPLGNPKRNLSLSVIESFTNSSFQPNRLPAFDGDSFFGQRAHAERVKAPLGLLYALVQRRRSILGQDRHRFLRDDRAAVHALIHEMDG